MLENRPITYPPAPDTPTSSATYAKPTRLGRILGAVVAVWFIVVVLSLLSVLAYGAAVALLAVAR